MAVQFLDEREKEEAEQLSYLGLPKPKIAKVRASGTDTPRSADEEPIKKKGSALPLLVGAAAVVFLMAKK